MLTLYGLNTPNVYKVTIGLEEMGLHYNLETIDVRSGKQFDQSIVDMNPNAKIPILRDDEMGITVSESNAILHYLAEKTGQFFPSDKFERTKGMELLFFQAASIGPLFGQRAHFAFHAGDTNNEYALERYSNEGERLYSVMDEYLSRSEKWFLKSYSIVDMAIFGWVYTAVHMGFGVTEYSYLNAWYFAMKERPAVMKGVATPDMLPTFPEPKRPLNSSLKQMRVSQ
ncbi:glutathione S-transferase family protein [Kiloniella majae]|uniref:glutathione S-transferase family protein n=1 Tax=Kiloniella majae TaxID=1938558 RepID=UPI000A279739|nr:glutathione S-transferase family protein [Kiloniella majae]